MRSVRGLIFCAVLLLAVGAAFGQTPPAAQTAPTAPAAPVTLAFDVASIRPSPPIDQAKMLAAMLAGKMPRFGANVEGSPTEYDYMSLKDLIAYAYKVKAYQVTGLDWLGTERFDIVAKMPDGAMADDAPKMMQALLEERFKLAAHKDTEEHPVLGLVVGKGGPKLKEADAAPTPLDPDAPLKAGEMKFETPDGPARMTRNPDGSSTVNMGAKGTMTQRMDGQTLHLEASSLTMAGFADRLTGMMKMMQIGGGGSAGGQQVVDMTELKGNYQVAVEVSFADLMANARAQGMNVPGPGGAADASGALGASDPSGSSTVFESVQKLGLKLEPRKAKVEQVVVDHAEKTPTEN